MIILYLVPVRKIKDRVPEQLKVAEIFPGLTMGGIYAARYGRRGRNFASEFGIMPSYVHFGDRKGFFIDHLCAENNQAREGCSRGSFSWSGNDRLVTLKVGSEEGGLAQIKMRPLLQDIPFAGTLPFVFMKGGNIVYLQNHFISKIGISLSRVVLPADSPLNDFPFGPKVVTAFWDASNIVFQEPEYAVQGVMKQKKILGTPMGSSRGARLYFFRERQGRGADIRRFIPGRASDIRSRI